MRRTCVLLLLLASGAAQADAIYHYKQGDGTRVYTDRKPERGRYFIIGKNGRPTASASCQGMTAHKLEQRASAYDALIEEHAQAQQVPAALVRAVMRVESCFDRRAVSRAGARGLMQLMPMTAQELGVLDSFDAGQNIGGGVRYLRQMLERFQHNTRHALAAYNAGPQAVSEHGGIPPFPETRDYVQRVLAAYDENRRKAALRQETSHALAGSKS